MQQQQILVVDDSESIREIITHSLSPDYKIQCASCGEDAIHLMTEHPSDLAILDTEMPGTNGWETLRVFKDEQNGWPEMPIIMLSVHKEPEFPLKSWTLGAAFYLTKPFSLLTLKSIVIKALEEGKRFFSPA